MSVLFTCWRGEGVPTLLVQSYHMFHVPVPNEELWPQFVIQSFSQGVFFPPCGDLQICKLFCFSRSWSAVIYRISFHFHINRIVKIFHKNYKINVTRSLQEHYPFTITVHRSISWPADSLPYNSVTNIVSTEPNFKYIFWVFS